MPLFNSLSRAPHWLLAVAAILLLWRLDYAPLWNPDEGRYATSALEMVQPINGATPDWVVPHLNTIARLNKPPLVYWTAAVAFRIFGPSAGAGRLASALAAIAIMLIIWRLAGSMFGAETGLLSALVWATSVFSFGMARVLNTDMLLSFTMTLILWGLWRIIEKELAVGGRQFAALSSYLITGIGMGLAMLAKGPVGVALPLLIAFLYLCLARRWGALRRNWSWPGAALAVLLAALISVPWYLAVAQRKPDFLVNFLWKENFGRFSGGEEFHDKTSPLFYLPVLLLGLWPWTPFLVQAVARLRSERSTAGGQAHSEQGRARLFLWLWAGFIVVFFSMSGTKLITYVLPAFPALAMLVGEALSSLSKRQPTLPAGGSTPAGSTPPAEETHPGWWTATLAVSWALNLLLIVAVIVFLLADKILPHSTAMPFVIALGGILAVGSLALFWCWRRREAWPLTCTQAVTALALYFVLLGLAGRAAPYEDISPMMQALRPHLHPRDRVIEYKAFQPTAIFYLARPITVIDYPNTSGLDENELRSSPFYWTDAPALYNFLAGEERVFVLVRSQKAPAVFPTPVYPLAYNNDYTLLSNRPAPPGFHYDFRAPRK
ncbi:MAG TPA: glycosyltransferase family 39 protein [Abditibacteriaceae bacterium]|nr:glycosyltransferase family 39 protein [Abditibacteriaceae bacterium]